MTDTLILPTADAIIAPVIAKLISLRPNSAQYLNGKTGNYWHPVLGFRGQAAKMLERLADLIAARKLTATGTDLLDYVASEFDAVTDLSATNAAGTITLGRGTDPSLPGGAYPKGTKITRTAFNALGIDIPAGEYETLIDASVQAGSTATVAIPIRATSSGEGPNHPLLVNTNGNLDQITIPSLVGNMVVVDFEAGGGSKGAPTSPDGTVITIDEAWDRFVRIFARAYAKGQWGPTADAGMLGAFSYPGVRHVAVYDNPAEGSETILVADPSWGSSSQWAGAVQQSVYDANLVGFGCKVGVKRVRNRVVTANLVVSLRDTGYLSDTTDIFAATQDAVQSYFDDRLDWYIWNKNTLGAAVSNAHSKIYQCTSATVIDAATGLEVPEILTPDYTVEQIHNLFATKAMQITFTSPG